MPRLAGAWNRNIWPVKIGAAAIHPQDPCHPRRKTVLKPSICMAFDDSEAPTKTAFAPYVMRCHLSDQHIAIG
jgi:hypothetical protein